MSENKNDIQQENVNIDDLQNVIQEDSMQIQEDNSMHTDESTQRIGIFGKKDRHSRCKEEIETLKAEKAELHDKFLRLYSEFDNFRKRTQKERLDIIKNASESLMLSILPVIDDMERAIKYNAQPEADINAIREGELLIYQKFTALLKQKGLTVIETKDCLFNTDFHEAISIVPAQKEEDKGKILEEVEKGYILNEKVIRFAKVIIYQ